MNFISSQELRVMLVELLLAEKDATRECLRAEMDRLVDPMLESIFNRLQTKLTNGLERTQSVDGDRELMNPTEHELADVNLSQSYTVNTQPSTLNPQSNNQPHSIDYEPENDPNGGDDYEEVMNNRSPLESSHDQVDQSVIHIAQPSTSSHLMPQHQNVHYSYQQPNDQINFNESFNQHSEMRPFDLNSVPTMSPNVQANVNEPTDQANCPPSLFPTNRNEQSNQNLNDEVDEICECDECVNGIVIDDQVESDDDSDSVQWIEDVQDEDELQRTVKRPRLESTQPYNPQPEFNQHCLRQPIDDDPQPNQVNNQDKLYITVYLQCPELDCPDKLAEHEFTDHLMDEHSIGPNRCFVKDCKRSFPNNVSLGDHIKHAHQSTTEWHCGKCSKQFAKYLKLSKHNYYYHQLGHFQCSFPACTFTGEYKQKVYDHYRQHKVYFVCSHSDCDFQTTLPDRFKAHERVHLNIKPFRCKWPNCHFSSTSHNYAMMHIKTHFNPQTSSSDVTLSGKPTDYLEVVHSLL